MGEVIPIVRHGLREGDVARGADGGPLMLVTVADAPRRVFHTHNTRYWQDCALSLPPVEVGP